MSGQPLAHFNFARDVMERWAQLRPHDFALSCVEEGGANDRRHTFADIADQFRRAANFFQEHCKRVTAPCKYPREIEFVTELPKTIRGKIRRVDLRERG